ncbi:MAG: HDOD domain-containing protein [Sulfuritalea sp.]|nr:HDOD domain-containing protein [Sulfuritalea sp.]
MASFFDRLLGKNEPAAARKPGGSGPAGIAASSKPARADKPPPASAAEPAQSFVCREPVLDRDKRIAGYQFSLPEAVAQRLQSDFEFLQKIYDDAVLRNLTSLGDDALLGPRLALVRLSPESLDNPRLHELPRDNTVLMLAPVHQTLEAERILRQLDILRQAGFSYGWLLRQDQVAQFSQLPIMAASADYVQIDAPGFDGMGVRLLVKALTAARSAKLPRLRLIAGGLNAVDEFDSYFQADFDFFLGPFVTGRESWHPPKSNINRLQIIKLLNLLGSDAEIAAIAEQFRHDPVLAFKLLRYINSAAMGLRSPVVNMDKALILLGREKIYRWLSLLLFDFKAPGHEERVLTEQALARAHFLENLAGEGNMPAQTDALFILGLFSLLDQLMGQTMAELLVQAKLPKAVHDALVGQQGPYRNALLLAIAAEGQSPLALEQQAALCGLEALQVSQCVVKSLAWAHEISSLDAA